MLHDIEYDVYNVVNTYIIPNVNLSLHKLMLTTCLVEVIHFNSIFNFYNFFRIGRELDHENISHFLKLLKQISQRLLYEEKGIEKWNNNLLGKFSNFGKFFESIAVEMVSLSNS